MHSEEIVSQLAEIGVNCVSTHYFKGFGMAAEAEEQEKAARLTELYHKYGIRVFGYHQFGTIVYETFLKEVPHAKDWIQRDENGNLLLYGGRVYWRWTACPLNEEHKDYLRRCIKKALTEAKMDGIEWDGTVYNCHCETCQQAFREYLKERYPSPERDFGLPFFDYVRLPAVASSRDPLYQEAQKFRHITLRDKLREFYLYVKDINPDAAVVMYPGWPAPEPRPYDLDIIVDENHDLPHIHEGKLTTRLEPCKRGNAAGRLVLNTSWMRDPAGGLRRPENRHEIELALAECAAYGGHIITATWALRSQGPGDKAFFEQPEQIEPLKRYMGFFKAHEYLYDIARPLANVAVYRPFAIKTERKTGTSSSILSFEMVLAQEHIPFELVFPDNMKRMYDFDLLVLANHVCMSDEETREVESFINKGGKVIATHNTSQLDERFRERMKPGMKELFQHENVLYIPKPPNRQEIADAVNKMLPDSIPLTVSASKYVLIDAYELTSGAKTISFVNYDNENAVDGITVQLGAAFDGCGIARYYSPDNGSAGLELTISDGQIAIPELRTYGIVVVQ